MYRFTDNTPERLPVAVYGTLRTGGGNDVLWSHDDGVQSAGIAALLDVALVMRHRGFPYGISSPGSGTVAEVLVSDEDSWPDFVRRLDRLEGHPDFYTRTQQIVRIDNAMIPVWTYLILSPMDLGGSTVGVGGNDWASVDRDLPNMPVARLNDLAEVKDAPVTL